jgi:hypothetical protein
MFTDAQQAATLSAPVRPECGHLGRGSSLGWSLAACQSAIDVLAWFADQLSAGQQIERIESIECNTPNVGERYRPGLVYGTQLVPPTGTNYLMV